MKNLTLTATALLALSAFSAFAGGIDRALPDYGLMFQSGNQLSFSTSLVNPNISGKHPAALGGGSSGNQAKSFAATSLGVKSALTDRLSVALYLSDAYGAEVSYEQAAYTGLRADWASKQTTIMLRYALGDRISVYGGARHLQSKANIVIPDQLIRPVVANAAQQAQGAVTALTGAGAGAADPRLVAAQTQLATLNAVLASPFGALQYGADGDQTGEWGYVLGAAYEVPDIALRVALTYESAIIHQMPSLETLPGFGVSSKTDTEIEMPQSLALDFQTGVAPGTLVFGQIKWTEWSKWAVRTTEYAKLTGGPVTDFDHDLITYRLGIGRQFSEAVSGFAQVTYEKSNNTPTSALAPKDGLLAFGIGGQIVDGPVKIRGGIEYIKLGDAMDILGTAYEGNSAFGAGLTFTVEF